MDPNDRQQIIDLQNFNLDRLKNWAPKFSGLGLFLLLVLYLILPKTGIWYTIDSDEAGVVKTWGRVTDQTGAGLHFKLPYPVQAIHVTPLTRVLRFEYGYRTRDPGGDGQQPIYEYDQEYMLTEDANILDNEYAIQFRVKDPIRWVLAAEDIKSLVYHAARASMSQVIGANPIDDALTQRKEELQIEVQNVLQEALDRYQAGVVVSGVKFQNPSPPQAVQEAFDQVQSAKERRETLINNAEAFRNRRVNEAKGEAATTLETAKAYKYTKIQTALGEANRFQALLSEYAKAPEVTRKRLYYEMITDVLPQIQSVYIMDESGSVLKYLPLDAMRGQGGNRN